MGLVTEVVAHARLLDRTVDLATQICEVVATVMQGLKAIYVAGAAAIIDPALTAEQTFAASFAGHTDGWASAIDRSPNITDRRSAGQVEDESRVVVLQHFGDLSRLAPGYQQKPLWRVHAINIRRCIRRSFRVG